MRTTIAGLLTKAPSSDMKPLEPTERQRDIVLEAKRHPSMHMMEFTRYLQNECGISTSHSYVREVLLRADPVEWYDMGSSPYRGTNSTVAT